MENCPHCGGSLVPIETSDAPLQIKAFCAWLQGFYHRLNGANFMVFPYWDLVKWKAEEFGCNISDYGHITLKPLQ